MTGSTCETNRKIWNSRRKWKLQYEMLMNRYRFDCPTFDLEVSNSWLMIGCLSGKKQLVTNAVC
jgi:hypothetical protein